MSGAVSMAVAGPAGRLDPIRLGSAARPAPFRGREVRLYEPVRRTVNPAARGPQLGRSAWQPAETGDILNDDGDRPAHDGAPRQVSGLSPSSITSSTSGS